MKRFTYLSLLLIFAAFSKDVFCQNKIVFSSEDIYKHISTLASDSLKGRNAGSIEGQKSAKYIKDNFIKSNLTLKGEDGFQSFKLTNKVTPDSNSFILFEDNGRKTIYKISKNFSPKLISNSEDFQNISLCFAGYGIVVKKDSITWNSYQNLSPKNKIVMILEGYPKETNKSNPLKNYSSTKEKILNAEDLGAKGIIIISRKQSPDAQQGNYDRSGYSASIPIISISRNLADSIFKANNFDLEKITNRIDKTNKAKDINLNIFSSGKIKLKKNTSPAQNVIAAIEGYDPKLKNEAIVIGAHYDHLGMGGEGSGSRMPDTIAVHYGADDNASGVTALIELAKKLKPQKRTLIFIAFDAEEKGLIGSNYFCKNPIFDLNKIQAMINLDMIGRLDSVKKNIMIGGTKTSKESETILNKVKKTSNLNIAYSPEGFGASDHASFYAKDIPVFFFSTGAHPDYHTPFDRTDRINIQGIKEILNFTYNLIIELANGQDLNFQEAGPKTAPSRPKFKVTLGIMPDFTSSKNNGLGVGGIKKGGAAYHGKMKKGDIITAIDGKKVKNIYDYMNRLKHLKPNQTITVDILRDNEHKVLIIKL
ncbi:MAG: M20/M25/M40 family metallo-hydrolase [Bacteroidales bacterium]